MIEYITERWNTYISRYPKWHEIIAIEDHRDFLHEEYQYCKQEFIEFQKHNQNGLIQPLDTIRKAVLDKRIAFLKIVVRNNMFKFKPNAPLTKLK